MSWVKGRIARVRDLFHRVGAESRMSEEFAFHIARATEENIRAGMDLAEARRQALVAFGGLERHRETMRDTWRFVWLEDLVADVRFAVRWLGRSPGFTIVAVLTVAVGIGATTALFSVTNALLLRPLPVSSPEQLYSIQEERTGYVVDGIEGMQVPQARYEEYVEAASALFTDVAAHSMDRFALRSDGAAQPVSGVLVSGNYFRVLGVRPSHGRLFGEADDPVIVLSHRLWQGRFGGDQSVIGRTVYVDGRPLAVAGVAARGFDGTNVGMSADLWFPYLAAVEGGESAWSRIWLTPFGRLRPEVDPRQAEAMLPSIARSIEVDAPGAEVQGARLEPMTGLLAEFRPVVAGFLGLLLGMAALVLLIAASNIAGMQLARGIRRRREVAVRIAIGAGRGRLVRQLLTESLVLFLLGGAGGVLIAWWATGMIRRISLPIPALLLDVGPDLRVLGFGLAAAAMAGIAFGLLPAVRASRPELASALKDGAPTGGSRSSRGRGIFISAQIALAVVLLAVAGLFARTLQTALRDDPGFDPEDVVVASFDLSSHDYDEEGGHALQTRLLERIRSMGDVESAALARIALLTGSSLSYRTGPADDPDISMSVGVNEVDPEYFRTMRIELLSGRGFVEHAGEGGPTTVVVNQTLAQRFWPDDDALGKLLRRGDREFEVVGVARDGRYRDFQEEPRAFAFFPLQSSYAPRIILHVRTRTPAAEIIRRIRDELALHNPDIALEQAAPLTQLIEFGLMPQRIGAYLVGIFGLLGLLLAGVGLYGVLSYQVADRARELGIRVALGASTGAVIRLVLRGIALVAVLGVAVGVVLATALGLLIQGFLFGISVKDPITFTGVPLLLAAVALLASLVPLRRAIRADPLAALRQE